MRRLFGFPDPVNEVSARLVAAGVVVVCVLILVLDQPWLLIPLAYGFVARVLTGPTLSPLGLLVTHVVTPRFPVRPRLVPGSPKRFAQGMGASMATAAVVAHFAFGAASVADVLVAMILVAATLEAALGLCLGCKIFGVLIRTGLIPDSVCAECGDIAARRPPATAADRDPVETGTTPAHG